MPPTISLVIPTVSRPTLARTLASLRAQPWRAGDSVVLVGDGPQPVAADLWRQFRLPGLYAETPARLGFWGHGARNWVRDRGLATGDYLVALDDDDEWTPSALAVIRASLAESPGRPHIFRMAGCPVVGTVWKDKEVRLQNVGTPLLVAPNVPGKIGAYTERYGGDFDMIAETCVFYPDGPVWREEVICNVRPYRGG